MCWCFIPTLTLILGGRKKSQEAFRLSTHQSVLVGCCIFLGDHMLVMPNCWLQEVHFPSKLQSLSLGEMFNHPLERVTLPEKLQSLNFGRRRTVEVCWFLGWWVLWGNGFVFQGWWLFVLKDFGTGNRLIFRVVNSSFGKRQNLSSKSVYFRWTKGFATMMSNIPVIFTA